MGHLDGVQNGSAGKDHPERVVPGPVGHRRIQDHLGLSRHQQGHQDNDPIDHATGLEKYELLAEQAGNDDPFFCKAQAMAKGTKDEPNVIQALDVYRMVGCVCHPDDTNIKWMWLYKDQPKRCQCGYWFKLESHEPPNKAELPL